MAEERSAAEQIRSMYGRLPRLARIGILVLAVALVFWFLWSTVSSMLRTWEPVSTGVSGSQQAEILNVLRTRQIPYRIEGGTIMVPTEVADETKIELSGQGLQADPLIGLERLESIGMGDTDKTIDAKTRLALQEELQKGLNSLSMVTSSMVQLALPADSAWITEREEQAKASIWLTLNPEMELSRQKVRGLQIQIANSIRGLQPENVSILDQHFNLLSVHVDEEGQLGERQNAIEKDIEKNVREVLEPVVGERGVRVAASVNLNQVAEIVTETTYDTDNPAETSYEVIEEESTEGAGSGGVPGSETNTGEITSGGGPSSGQTSRTEERRQTKYSEVIKQREQKPGEVKRMTVAVWIDMQPAEGESEDESEYVSWGEEKLSEWERKLKDAVGFDENRGDSLTITETSFDYLHRQEREFERRQQVEQTQRLYNIFDWSDWTSFVKIPLLLLTAILLVWFILRPVTKVVLAPLLAQLPGRAPAQIPDHLPKTVEELEAEIEGQLEEDLELPGKEVKKGTILKKRLTELAKNEPETFSQLVRSWLYE